MAIKIAIIGKTNTGKSTLFNRLVGFRKAIVLKESGITRDRNYADIYWKDRKITLIDTGGIDYGKKRDFIQEKVVEQSKKAIVESDIILFVVDFMSGIQQEDIDIAKIIRKNSKKAILIVNKDDIKNKNFYLTDFFKLGIGNPFPISAEQGKSIFELLDNIVSLTKDITVEAEIINKEEEIVNIAIIGKPNVGKSSILNALLDDERIIVDNSPGTTRDSIEVSINYENYIFNFVDTSGLRRKRNVKEKVEYFSNKRAIDSIKKADIVLLILDANFYISMQDKRLAERIIEEKKACIVVLNKYDLILQNKEIDKILLLKMCKYELRFLKESQIITTIAAGLKKNVSPILNAIVETYKEYNKKISTPELNNFLQKIVNQKPPKIVEGKRLKFYYITQTGVKPPTFKVFVNQPNLLYNSYQRYIENQFMQYFDINGIPLDFHYLKRK